MTEDQGTPIVQDEPIDITSDSGGNEPIAEQPLPEGTNEHNENAEEVSEDPDSYYEELIADDIRVLRSQFPELASMSDITELKNPLRYAKLRDLGLEPAEAYLATSGARYSDNRAHLAPSYTRGISDGAAAMPRSELSMARELFSGMSDKDIQMLYRRVTR